MSKGKRVFHPRGLPRDTNIQTRLNAKAAVRTKLMAAGRCCVTWHWVISLASGAGKSSWEYLCRSCGRTDNENDAYY